MVRESNNRSIRTTAAALPRRRRRHDARRDGILRAAARMFRERGFAETGMRDIAGAADLSAANLYHYFGGKDEILYYCQDRALDQMLGAAGATRRGDHPYADQLREILAAHVRTLLDGVEGATAHLQTESLPPALRRRIVAKRDRYERAIRRLVSAGIEAGEFAAMDPAVVTRAMLGAVNWTVTWFRPEGPSSSESIADTIARFLVRGIDIDVIMAAEKFRLTLTVNRETVDALVDTRKTLLEVLREDLQLTGTKHGCELGECGACAVLLDGQPVLSCLALAVECVKRSVTTVEGLAEDGRLHPLQERFADLGAAQCGYCTPGILVTAKALLDRNPKPDKAAIREALSGNLCRCTGYLQIIEAVEAAGHREAASGASAPKRDK